MHDFLPSPKAGELIKADHIAQITKSIRKRTPRNSPTVKVVETADGFYLEANAMAGAISSSANRGLQVYWSGALAVSVRPGTVLGLMPTIGGTSLDYTDPPSLECARDGTRYVAISIDTTLNTTTYSGETFVQNATANTAVITLETTAPDANDLLSATGDFQILLATIVNGVITQNGYSPFTGYVADNGSVNSTGQLVYETA